MQNTMGKVVFSKGLTGSNVRKLHPYLIALKRTISHQTISHQVGKLKVLSTVQLCDLVHKSGLPDCVPFIKSQELTGLHVVDGIESAQDLVDSGLTVIKAKTLFKRIEEWKTVGFPVGFDMDSAAYPENTLATTTAAPIVESTPSTTAPVIVSSPADQSSTTMSVHFAAPVEPVSPIIHMEHDYNTARWCSDEAAVGRLVYAAAQSDPIALMHLSVLHGKGCKGFPINKTLSVECASKALPWLQQHAHSGDASAQYYLGYLHMNGLAVSKNEPEGVRYYQQAADQGLSIALNALGTCYLFGVGVPKYEEVGVSYFRQAISKGSVVGEINLACCFLNGTGVETNESEAVRLFRKPAELGYANVQHYLGMCYLEGKGVVQDDKKAIKHLLSAAKQDYIDSIVTLGYLHEVGKGVSVDVRTALTYYREGVRLGSTYAVQAVERVIDLVDEEEVEKS